MTTIGKFTLFTLGEFSDWLFKTSVSRVIRQVQNHHTFIPNYTHFKGSNHFEMLKGMESSHLERGFSEIAQNLTTFPDGTVALCRSLDKIPAGVKGANANGICIENVGNFDLGGDAMTIEQKNTIVDVNAALCKKFSLTPNTNGIVYHHWYDLITGARTNGTGTTKTCPGTAFFGGNTVEAATSNFIPLIQSALVQMVHAPNTVDVSGLAHGVINVASLNVRAGSGTGFDVVKVLKQGTHIAIYENRDGWYRIAAEQQWVKSDYITV